jgi:hypothetical protein
MVLAVVKPSGTTSLAARHPRLQSESRRRACAAPRTDFLQLLDLDVRDALDGQQALVGGVRQPLDGVDASLLQLFDVRGRDAHRLQQGQQVRPAQLLRRGGLLHRASICGAGVRGGHDGALALARGRKN